MSDCNLLLIYFTRNFSRKNFTRKKIIENIITLKSIIEPPEKIFTVMIIQPFTRNVKNFRSTKYYKKLQITIDAVIPIISPISAATNIPLVFFIFTQLVYTAIVYRVVSVDPIITEAILPIFESTP